ncbi:hypothetical protein K502DRAFT_328402 [Neoconidiobolus thromboides FSU 785]|nr:hypothetical protein K502DRAFT_328402 [Neoconidiobolus thromboides FSU 785]
MRFYLKRQKTISELTMETTEDIATSISNPSIRSDQLPNGNNGKQVGVQLNAKSITFVPRKKTNAVRETNNNGNARPNFNKFDGRQHQVDSTDSSPGVKINKNKFIPSNSNYEAQFLQVVDKIAMKFPILSREYTTASNNIKGMIELSIAPSDPEFPYELEKLNLKIIVGVENRFQLPSLVKVLNADIPRAFAVNIEGAFIKQCNLKKNQLIENLVWLDRNLTEVLKRPEANIIKFVRRAPVESGSMKINDAVSDNNVNEKKQIAVVKNNIVNSSFNTQHNDLFNHYNISVEKKQETETVGLTPELKMRREKEITQIERRFRRHHKVICDDKDKYVFEVKLEPSDPDFKFKKECSYYYLTITIPALYPTQGSSISLKIIPGRQALTIKDYMFKNVEKGFNDYASKSNTTTILHCVNWLDTRLESLMTLPPLETSIPTPPKSPEMNNNSSKIHYHHDIYNNNSKTHYQHEMNSNSPKVYQHHGKNGDKYDFKELIDSKESYMNPYSKEKQNESLTIYNDNEHQAKEEMNSQLPPPTSHNGIQLKFSNHEIKNVSLLIAESVELEAVCERCKARLASPKLLPHHQTFFSCSKCNNNLALRFRPTIIHHDSDSLGYLDNLNCSPISITKVSLTVSCNKCENLNIGLNGFKSILLSTTVSEICRSCHTHFSVEMGLCKFIRLAPSAAIFELPTSTSNLPKAQLLGVLPRKEKLDIKLGTPLPSFGTCSHYRKSYRWLRFPCCGQAFPCSTCHDQSVQSTENNHESVYATSMICGYCSKEFNYFSGNQNQPQCKACGHLLTHSSKGKAFWEGGKGTRDRSKMNKNEGRKYKGLNKTVSKKKQAEEKI